MIKKDKRRRKQAEVQNKQAAAVVLALVKS